MDGVLDLEVRVFGIRTYDIGVSVLGVGLGFKGFESRVEGFEF